MHTYIFQYEFDLKQMVHRTDIGGEKMNKTWGQTKLTGYAIKKPVLLDLCFVGEFQVGEAESPTLYQYLNGKKN